MQKAVRPKSIPTEYIPDSRSMVMALSADTSVCECVKWTWMAKPATCACAKCFDSRRKISVELFSGRNNFSTVFFSVSDEKLKCSAKSETANRECQFDPRTSSSRCGQNRNAECEVPVNRSSLLIIPPLSQDGLSPTKREQKSKPRRILFPAISTGTSPDAEKLFCAPI